MDLQVTTEKGSKTMTVSDAVMGVEFNEGLVHQVVNAFLAGARAGTKAQKSRSDVSGGGAKPWRQKGTGRARAGTSRSPIWRSGGVTFAAKPRNFRQKVNKKVYRKAICCILAELNRNEKLQVVDGIHLESSKTKDFVGYLAKYQQDKENVLIITDELTENLYLSSRNVPDVCVIDSNEVNPYLLMKFKKVIVTEKALAQIEEQLQ